MTELIEVGSRCELTVDGINSEGAGVGRLSEGRAVFTPRTAPGDRIVAEITSVHRRWARARLLELRTAGADRRRPLCPHYDWCGGCTLDHLSYRAQLRLKGSLVSSALKRIGRQGALPQPSLRPSPREIRYRNRVTMTLTRTNSEEVAAGFHRLEDPGSVLDVDGRCLLPEEPISRVWDALRKNWGPGAHRLPPGPSLRLTLRVVGGEDVLLLVDGGNGPGDPDTLIAEVPGLRAIWHRKSGSSQSPGLIAGEPRLTEMWHGEEVEVRPTAFLQANRKAAAQLHDRVIAEAGAVRGRRVIDAYCGFGAFGRRLALSGALAVGIEADLEAVRMSTDRPVSTFKIMQGKVEDLLSEALPADLAILNPPRTGVGRGVMESLAGAGTGRIIYVSCDPATLARDVHRLGEGYRISRIDVFDLFPQTAHVETVLTLEAE